MLSGAECPGDNIYQSIYNTPALVSDIERRMLELMEDMI
jgi:hypothetical protein